MLSAAFGLEQVRKTHFTNIHFLEIRESTRKDKKNNTEIKCITFAYQESFRKSCPPYVGLVHRAASFASGMLIRSSAAEQSAVWLRGKLHLKGAGAKDPVAWNLRDDRSGVRGARQCWSLPRRERTSRRALLRSPTADPPTTRALHAPLFN